MSGKIKKNATQKFLKSKPAGNAANRENKTPGISIFK